MTQLRLLVMPVALTFACTAGSGDDAEETDETDVATSEDDDEDDADDADDADDTDDASADDTDADGTDDTDIPLTVDVSDWDGLWSVTVTGGELCGASAPSSVVITGTSATTFTIQTDYGTPACAFTTDALFGCETVTYAGAQITASGAWDGEVISAAIHIVAPTPCDNTQYWTVTPPSAPAEPAGS